MRGFFMAVLVAVLALPAMPVLAGEEARNASPPVGGDEAAAPAPVMPARGEVKEIEPGHWVAHLRDDNFIDLFVPKGEEKRWSVVGPGPDGKPQLQVVEEMAEPGAPEGVRRFQVPFQYVGADDDEVACLVTGTIVEGARGLVRVIDVFDIPEQRVKVVRVEVPGPERVVVKKKRSSTGALLGGLALVAGIWALTSGGGDGGGKPTPDGRLEKYCPYWRQHVADDHAAGRNTDRGDYTYDGATWEEVDRKLQEHLRTCPYAIAGGFDPQNDGPGVGDSLIQAHRVGGLEMGIPLDRRTRLTTITGDLALVRRERGFSLSLHQDGSWGVGNEWLGFRAGPGDRQFEIAASAKWRTGGVNLRLSNFGGDWMGGISLQKAF